MKREEEEENEEGEKQRKDTLISKSPNGGKETYITEGRRRKIWPLNKNTKERRIEEERGTRGHE